jgi:ketosteroid isomerase-like protein
MSEIQLIERFNQAFNDHDVEGVLALMTDDCLFENTYPPPDGERIQGKPAMRAWLEEFFAASTQAYFEFEEIVLCGESAFQRWIYRWVDADGAAGHVRGVDVFHLRDGKVAQKLSHVKG